MNKSAYIASFVFGVMVGVVIASIYKKKNDEQEFEPVEVEDIPEEFTESEVVEEPVTETVIVGREPDPEKRVVIKETIDKIVKDNGYSIGDHTNLNTDDGPYIIGPADFGEFSDYDAICMTLLSDGILVDDRMMTVDDPENSVGTEYKKYFGVYPNDPDTVYVRNDELCRDFEIVKDLRTYEEVESQRPHLRWSDNE